MGYLHAPFIPIMKRTIVPFLLAALPLLSVAQDLPAPSPAGVVKQRVGLTDITVEYSRPSAKGRAIFGDLVPFDQVWRTGANKATSVEFSTAVSFAEGKLDAGKYSLFTIPGKESWQIIFNKNTELWGAFDRKAEEDVLTLKVPSGQCETTETFTIEFATVKDDKALLRLRWENTAVDIPILADATDQALANIKEALAKDSVDFRTYARSASFCLDHNMMQKEALGWAQKSVSMEKKYWNTFTLASAYYANGDAKSAVATANEALALAEKESDQGAVKNYSAKIAEWSKK